MLRDARWHQRGDTLIEVMMATAILSVVAVSALVLMNRGLSTTVRAIEVTQARQEMDSQVEMLRYLRDAAATALANNTASTASQQWGIVVGHATANGSSAPTQLGTCPADFGSNGRDRFYLTPGGISSANVTDYPGNTTAGGVPTAGEGVWVEAYPGSGSNASYIDFHVRACWQPIADASDQALGTVVRLFTPQNQNIVAAAMAAPAGSPTTTSTAPCTNRTGSNLVRNGDFSIAAGPGFGTPADRSRPNVAPAAGFMSDLPNRGTGGGGNSIYPDDEGDNGTTSVFTGGFAIQRGIVNYRSSPGRPLDISGKPFPGDFTKTPVVPASNTYFYSNPNQNVNQPAGTRNTFTGVLWSQRIAVDPDSTYDFTAYFDNLLNNNANPSSNDPEIQLRVDGDIVRPIQNIARDPDVWVPVTLQFDTDSRTSILLQVLDFANTINGDDFGMTGIGLYKCA